MNTRFLKVGVVVAAAAMALPLWILAGTSERPKIGFAIEAMKGERWQTDLEAFQARAKALGADVVQADAGGDGLVDEILQRLRTDGAQHGLGLRRVGADVSQRKLIGMVERNGHGEVISRLMPPPSDR